MSQHTYFYNSPVERVVSHALDYISEEGYIAVFTKDYAALSDIERFEVIDTILNEYRIGITDFIYDCLNVYSELYSVVNKEFKKAHRLYLNDSEDELAIARYKTWATAKERLTLQKRLIIKCVIDYSAHLSYDLESEIKNYL